MGKFISAEGKGERTKPSLNGSRQRKGAQAKSKLGEAKKALKAIKAPKSAQDSIRYIKLFEGGVCEAEEGLYSATIKFSDVNYQAARREEQAEAFVRLCELYNLLSPDLHLQLTVHSRRIDSEAFRKAMLMGEAGDGLDSYRAEMDAMLLEQAFGGQAGLIREKYATVSLRAPSLAEAEAALGKALLPIEQQLGYIGCSVERLGGMQRAQLIHSMTRPGEKALWGYASMAMAGLSTKDAVAPSSFDFRPMGMFRIGGRPARAMFLKDMPATLSDSLIKELAELPIDMSISVHVDPIEQSAALEMAKRKIALLDGEQSEREKKAYHSGYSAIMPINMREALEGYNSLLDELSNKSQKLFKAAVVVVASADTDEALEAATAAIAAAAQKRGCSLARLDYMQEEGFNSALPLGKCHVPAQRYLTTSSVAIFVPFTSMELFSEGGAYYGRNALTGSLAAFDRKSLPSPAGMLLGTPGSGKSFAAKREIASIMLSDPTADVIVIDPEREYGYFAEKLGGESINISAGSSACINPFDITEGYSGSDSPLKLKIEFIMGMCELAIGRGRALTSQQQSIINRACHAVYPPSYFAKPYKGKAPTLQAFYAALLRQPEPEAADLALALEQYATGALSAFSGETNISASSRLLVFDIRDLGKQLRPLGMLVVLDQIWCRITANRAAGKRTWVYVDEMQLLFSSESCEEYFFELWSRARKWGAIPTGITQNIETLLMSEHGRRMLSNSDFLMLFHQSGADIAEAAALLGLSEAQQAYAATAKEGQAVMIAGKAVIQVYDSFPKNTELYAMMTTKIGEAAAADGI